MPNFICKVITPDGSVMQRTVAADSIDAIKGILAREKAQLISVKKQGADLLSFDVGAYFAQFQKVTPKEMSLFMSQLRVMMDSGIPLLKCLEVLETQAVTPKFKTSIKRMHRRVESGESLSNAMAEHPNIFNDLFVNMIKAGESSGTLPQILEQLGIFNEIDIATQRNLKKAFRYPIIVMSVMAVAVVIVMVKVIPTFSQMLLGFGADLPLITKLMIGASKFLQEFLLLIVGAGVGLFFGFKWYTSTDAGEYQWDFIKLKLPVAKDILRTTAMARFGLIMKTLLNSGVGIVETLGIAKLTIGNRVYENVISNAQDRIVEGVAIHKSLESDYIPVLARNMIAIGEESASLNQMLTSVSDYYLGELDEKLEALSASIEPILTVIIGVFVAGFVASIFLPMFAMFTAVG